MAAFDSPIVIVGCRRSGTTLLRTILDNHPDLLVHPQEVQFFLELRQKFGTTIRDSHAAIEFVGTHPYRAENVTVARLADFFEGQATLSLAEFSQGYLAAWAGEEAPANDLVIKHPRLILHLDLVYGIFPNARVIHIVRDPRGNIASQQARWPKSTLQECTRWWLNSVRNGRKQSALTPSTFLEIRYEDLVLEPQKTLQEVCKFIDIPYFAELLNFELSITTFQRKGAAERKIYTRPDSTRLDWWRHTLPAIDVRLIEDACRHEMEWWAYTPDKPDVPVSRLIARKVTDSLTYTFHRIGKALRSGYQNK